MFLMGIECQVDNITLFYHCTLAMNVQCMHSIM